MKNNKIIIIFIAIIVFTSSGYFYYNHQQNVNTAQHNYDTGNYQKAGNSNVGDVSRKSKTLSAMGNWKSSYYDADSLDNIITLIYNEMETYKTSDTSYFDKLNVYYQEIANNFSISTTRLDDINKMSSSDRMSAEKTLLNQ